MSHPFTGYNDIWDKAPDNTNIAEACHSNANQNGKFLSLESNSISKAESLLNQSEQKELKKIENFQDITDALAEFDLEKEEKIFLSKKKLELKKRKLKLKKEN
ncbi:9903_t:CDS:2 [Gigaspora rosea]|nr:9903_t:CDS:2 [Gigaspora rosea]